MKTVTGNTVRFPLASFGTKVNSYAAAVAAVGFSIERLQMRHPVTNATLPGEFGLFRNDTNGCLGIHSANFGVIQPAESLKTLERARGIVGGEWSSVAVTKGGRQLAAFINIETAITAPKRGDKVGLSVAFFDRWDGGGKAKLQLILNVLACDNGMTKGEALINFSEKHCEGTLHERFAEIEFNLHMKLQTQIEEMRGIVTALDTKPMTRKEVVNFARALYPSPEADAPGSKVEVPTRIENTREAIVAGFFNGRGNVGKTRWDAFNAVTENLDWNGTFRETEFTREENRFDSILAGSAARTRNRALELLLA
jgi:hypothetical protein